MLIDHPSTPIQTRLLPRFAFDHEATKQIVNLFDEVEITPQHYRAWAIPPYDAMYMEFEQGREPYRYVVGVGVSTYFEGDERIYHMRPFSASKYSHGEPVPAPISLMWNAERWEFSTVDGYSQEFSAEEWKETEEFIKEILSIGFASILLLNRPSNVRLNSTPRTTKLVKGKRVVFHAHTTVKIDLSESRQYLKTFETGARGPVRAHQVRGHWVNWHKRTCDHHFEEREMSKPDRPSYRCTKCGQIRTWRPSFERGDASKGYATKTYEITKSR